MHRLLGLIMALVAGAMAAGAQAPEANQGSRIGYPSVAAALAAMKAKPGVAIASQGGWTIVEDPQDLTAWSFTFAGHPAHPAVVRRKVVKNGDDIFVEMGVLCEAPKPPCDKLVAEFNELNKKMISSLKSRIESQGP